MTVLGLSWVPCWPHFRGLGNVLGPFLAILGLVKPGHERSGQVRSSQAWSEEAWGPRRLWTGARSGQGGVHPSYKDGSALENTSSSCVVISNKNENFNYFSKCYALFCDGRADLKDLGLYGCFGGLGCEFEQDLKASWVHFQSF